MDSAVEIDISSTFGVKCYDQTVLEINRFIECEVCHAILQRLR